VGLRRLNPFARLPNGKAVFAWGMYDLANQSFQLLINTLLFSLFVQDVVVGDPAEGKKAWGWMTAASLLVVVVLSPITGAIADQRAWKRELLLASGVVCAVLTSCLSFLQPGQLPLAFVIYVIAAVACGLGENFLGSFLPEISTPKNVGYVSALGWTMSYVGALILLGLTAAYAFLLDRTEPAQMRPLLAFAGVWFLLGMLPAAVTLRERASPQNAGVATGTIVSRAFARLVESAKQTRKYRQLARFFLAFAVYSMGTMTVIYFLGLIGDGLGFELPQLILMAGVVAIGAGASSAATARVQDKAGHVRTVSFFLVLWIGSCLAIGGSEALHAPAWSFWVIGLVVGVALGGIGTASRAVVGAFTPEARAGEFFGIWGMVYKLAGMVGVLAFGQASALLGTAGAMGVVAMFFTGGLVLLWRVDEKEGVRAAGEAGASDPMPARDA
jgi:UMF1 family MFS transporter